MKKRELIYIVIGALLMFLSFYILLFVEDIIVNILAVIILVVFIPLSIGFFYKKPQKKDGKKSSSSKKELKREEEVGLNKADNNKDIMQRDVTEEGLYELSSVFPFDLFPNKVIISKSHVVIIYRNFFYTSQVFHFLIEDVLTPVVESSFFFSTLRLELGAGGYQQNPPAVKFLKKGEALKARRIIVGLLMGKKEDMDFEGLSPKELVEKAEELGRYKTP